MSVGTSTKVSELRRSTWRSINTSSVTFLLLYCSMLHSKHQKIETIKIWLLFLLSKLVEVVRMFASPPSVHLPKTLISPLHAKKYVLYARCSKSTTEQNDVVFILPISTSDGFAFGLIYTLTKLRAKKSCLLSRCILECIRYLCNFSPSNISRILNPMGRYRCCVASYLRSHARGSNFDTRKAMCSSSSHKMHKEYEVWHVDVPIEVPPLCFLRQRRAS